MGNKTTNTTLALKVAVLTVSDTENATDTENTSTGNSVQFLAEALSIAGHQLIDNKVIVGNVYQIRSVISAWVASSDIQVILITGGTGCSTQDNTPEAVKPLLDTHISGYEELFRTQSCIEVGTSAIQTRAFAGFVNQTVIFSMPGSTQACQTAWINIIGPQLDSRQGPCNVVPQLKGVDFSRCLSRK